MNTNFKLIALVLAITFLSCNQKNTLKEYKYADKGTKISCGGESQQLYNEALFAFEDDITNFYKRNGKVDLPRAYSQFIGSVLSGRAKFSEIITPHTVEVFKILKEENDLWDGENPKSRLNYKSDFFKCIANHIEYDKFKTTMNSLLITNSMSPKLFSMPLTSNYRRLTTDKYLAAYVAFDLFYAKLFDVDLSKVNENDILEGNTSTKENNGKMTPILDEHAGHNHS
ncbi:hypothetical protein [Changchengzhania lutea]|uniref:hypothetical protein n=1 Tax=Changchengzhania lutea TaxID=2049305 RepID=UPI00115EF334|nr:hypothetical protein [Changchengzhania lutea]